MKLNKKNEANPTSIRIGPVRFSYPKVFTPDAETGKYSVCVLIPKTDTEAIGLINDAIDAATVKGKAEKWGGKIPVRLKTPLRDGDEDHPDDEAFAGMMFFNCSSKNRPDVMVLEAGMRSEAIPDTDDFYAGCWGAITVNFYAYNSNGNVGVGAGLGNVIKTQDDERLGGGGASGDSDFSDLE